MTIHPIKPMDQVKPMDQAMIDMRRVVSLKDSAETLVVIQALALDVGVSSLDLSMPDVKQNADLSEDDIEVADIFEQFFGIDNFFY